MLRRFLYLSAGAIALLVVLGVPGQLHAQHMRGGGAHMMHPGFRSGVMPGFRSRFDSRFNRRSFGPRFDRFEDRFEMRSRRGFFDPRFNPGMGPLFFRPF